jgi:hypothetical protein
LSANDAPLEIVLSLNNTTLNIQSYSTVKLTLTNNSSFEIFDLHVDYQDNNFSTETRVGPSSTLASYTSIQGVYEIRPKNTGNYKLTYSVSYFWKDEKGVLHNRIDVVNSDEITVYKNFSFDWPNYLLPLVIGFVFGQLGTILGDWYRLIRETKLKLEQAKGVLLAGMQGAKKCVEKREEINFSFWDDLIVKENLYPSLARHGQKIKHPDLAKRLAELSILLKEYDSRYRKGDLNEDFVIDVEDELEALIMMMGDH